MAEEESVYENGMPAKPIAATNDQVQTATALWNEYKHRHDLIWRIVFQVTTAAVILSVVPYLAPQKVLKWLEGWIVAAPVLAFVLMVFAMVVVDHELDLLEKIRGPYWLLQKDWFGVPHVLPPKSNIRGFVFSYFFGMAVLSVTNSLICAMRWSY
jgi:hypothetical protein